MRILVVEDEAKMAALLRRGPTEESDAVDLDPTAEDYSIHTSGLLIRGSQMTPDCERAVIACRRMLRCKTASQTSEVKNLRCSAFSTRTLFEQVLEFD